jgi:hypothetical protein
MLHSSQRLQMSALEVELGLPRRINSHVPYAVNRMETRTNICAAQRHAEMSIGKIQICPVAVEQSDTCCSWRCYRPDFC